MYPIIKILEVLKESPEDRERFNKVDRAMSVRLNDMGNPVFYGGDLRALSILDEIVQERVVRTALSRFDGQCVLGCFEGGYDHEKVLSDRAYLNDVLYQSFDVPLRNGASYDYAITNLRHIMQRLNLL